ncbi:MAG: iron-containing alcohol dehydrogenase [Bacilli bacterium]|nr:iron-containing alcohol dehydrogenase [Bacilli bacterium]
MNFLKKIYCRTFQFCFKIAYPFLPYKEPVILNSLKELCLNIKEHNYQNVLLITDKGIRCHGITKPLEEELKNNDINCIVFDETVANPTTLNVSTAKDLYIKNQCQCLIAFGGGSAMDCTKAVGALIARPNKSLDKLKGLLKIRKKTPLIYAIPTTAGTGSEVTIASVITNEVTHHKYTLMDFNLIPSCAVLDPSVTYSLPKHLTATTGMDALTHAIEAYIGKSNTKYTRKVAIDAIRLILDNIEVAYNEPNNYEARKNMLYASYLAGIAFTRSYVGYVHAIAHSLGGQYNLPHGLLNAIILPKVLKVYDKSIYKQIHKLCVMLNISKKNDLKHDSFNKFINKIIQLNHNLGIKDHIEEINTNDILLMATHADKEANPLYPVPKLMDKKELMKIYRILK